jgi:mRNA interferase MazF
VVVIQGEAFNRSRIATVVCVMLTTNIRLTDAPGNVLIPAASVGLPQDSVANVSQIVTIDRRVMTDLIGRLTNRQLQLVLIGVDIVLGR